MSREAHTAVGWREAFGGEWTVDRAGYIWADSLKGGRCHVADVRGWGYLTGGGHGALGLSAEDAERISSEVGRLLCAAPALLDFAKALDASWTEDFPDGPDGDYSNRIVQPGSEHLALWRQCRAAIQSATGEG